MRIVDGSVTRVGRTSLFLMFVCLSAVTTEAAAQCHSNLQFLSGRIPHFRVADIENARTAILREDIVHDMQQGAAQGMTPQQAVQSLINDANRYDESARQALSVSNNFNGAGGTSDEGFLNIVRTGDLGFSACNGADTAALCAGVVAKLGAIASRAEAAEVGCYARAGNWPR